MITCKTAKAEYHPLLLKHVVIEFRPCPGEAGPRLCNRYKFHFYKGLDSKVIIWLLEQAAKAMDNRQATDTWCNLNLSFYSEDYYIYCRSIPSSRVQTDF